MEIQTSGSSGKLAAAQLLDLPAPEPAAGLDAYVRERELALLHSSARRENYEQYLRSSRRHARVDYLPIKLDIENVSRCNFRCTMCVVSDWPKGKRAADMPFEDFKQLIDEQYGLVEIKLQGIGEPTMQGDVFFEMIRYARSQHIWVRTATNASLLHLRDNYKKLVDSDINEIQISIDGADAATFEAIRRGSRFDTVIENCRLINSYCREKGVVRTKMWTVVQEGNQHQLEDLVNLAGELGFRNQAFELGLHGWGLEEWNIKNAKVNVEHRLDRERLTRLVEQGKHLGVKIGFWSLEEKYSTSSKEQLCPWPFERAVVTSDLRTVPCCVIGNPDAYELGEGEKFSQVWSSNQFADFRQAHLDGNIPKVCQACYSNEEGQGKTL
jgi:pyrroloquinoline quinone biosynthesis protein E